MQKISTLEVAVIAAIIAITTIAIPAATITRAASTSDSSIMQPDKNGATFLGPNVPNQTEKLSTSGSTEQSTNSTVAKTLVLTAIPDKPIVAPGKPETIHVKAAMENGTGVSNVTIRSMIIDYVTQKEKVLLGGQTDKKGELDLTATIGQHAKPGQFLAIINGTSNDQHKVISTGFTVNDKGSSSSSSSSSSSGSSSSGSGSSSKDSKGRCSGSSCR